MSIPQPDPATQPTPRSCRHVEPLPAEFFESSRARAAMGARDVRTVYAVLARLGVSQRRIAALTGQSQSEVSEIRAGRRVQAVDVIERIADGLGMPRGWWGLAHTDDAIPPRTLQASDGRPAQPNSSPPA